MNNRCAWCGLRIIGETRMERRVMYPPTCFLGRIAVLRRTRLLSKGFVIAITDGCPGQELDSADRA